MASVPYKFLIKVDVYVCTVSVISPSAIPKDFGNHTHTRMPNPISILPIGENISLQFTTEEEKE